MVIGTTVPCKLHSTDSCGDSITAEDNIKCGTNCDCGAHRTQTNIADARSGRACDRESCTCDAGHFGSTCTGTSWSYAPRGGTSCNTICYDVDLGCDDGDWGVHGEVSLWAAFRAAGFTPLPRCMVATIGMGVPIVTRRPPAGVLGQQVATVGQLRSAPHLLDDALTDDARRLCLWV